MKKFFDKPILNVFILFFLVPQPTMSSGAIIRFFSISVYILLYFNYHKFNIKGFINDRIYKKYKVEIILLCIYTLYETLLLFIQPLSKSNVTFVFRPIFFFLIFLFSIIVFEEKKWSNIKKEILQSIYIVMGFQILVSMLQLFDINILNSIYNADKSYPLGGLVRLTGTLGNPNIFAWYIGQFSLIVMLLEDDKNLKCFSIFLGLIFTFLTGSRTMLIITPTIWITTFFIKKFYEHRNKNIIFTFLILLLGMFAVLIGLLYLLEDVLPYAAQLLNILKGGLSSVNSFNMRLNMWRREIGNLNKNVLNWLFGFRTTSYISTDNDIIYGLTRSGIIGLILQYLFYLLVFTKLLKFKTKNILTIFLITSMIFSFIIGLQAETYMGWFYPVFQILFIGSQNELIIKIEMRQ